MNTIEAIFQRRSIKHFDPSHKLSQEEEKQILEAAIQSPTCFNLQHWRFVIVRDTKLRGKIRKEFGYDQAQMTDASLLIIITGDIKAWKKDPQRYWQNAPKEVAELLVNWIGPFHEGKEWLQRDEAQRSIGMVMQTIMLAAKDLGYDSCPMIGFDLDKVAQLINLPDDHDMGPMIAIGKKTKEPWPKPGQLNLNELVFENSF